MTAHQTPSLEGSLLGRYRLGNLIGSGGGGDVYRATDPSGAAVALKVLRSDPALPEGFRTRLGAEAELAIRARGAGIVAVLDVDTFGDRPYIVSEFIDAPNLAAIVQQFGPLPAPMVERLASTLMTAVSHLHRVGIVHGDLKPSNVLVELDGTANVVDFGVARLAAEAGHHGRTLGWTAPEVTAGATASVAADLFGWGLVVAYAANGRHPWQAIHDGAPLEAAIVATEPSLGALTEPLRSSVAAALSTNLQVRREAYVPSSFPIPATAPSAPALNQRPLDASRRRFRAPVIVTASLAVSALLFAAPGLFANDESDGKRIMVFDDTFRNGFSYNLFNGTNDVASTEVAHNGEISIATTPQQFEGIIVNIPDGLDLADFDFITMWINGGDHGASALGISASTAAQPNLGNPQVVTDIRSGQWKQVIVPLATLITDAAAFDSLTGRMLSIGSADQTTVGTLFLDQIEFAVDV